MSESAYQRLYSHLPVWAQNVACSIAGVRMRRTRYNRVFDEALEFLEHSQWWSLEAQQAYQNDQLGRIIKHAYLTVPYYKEVFDRLKLTPADIRAVEDLSKLPILEKSTVRQRFTDLQSKGWPKTRCYIGHTGGTTGTSLALLIDRDTRPWQWAVWWRHRRRFKLDLKDEFIVFAGRGVVPVSNMQPPIWRRNLPMHQTYVSVHHLSEQNLRALVNYLQRRRVVYYGGYPSALYLVACHLRENRIRLHHPPRIVLTGAETLLPYQRDAIEQAFDAEVADQYGASEHCGNISECEKHSYHVDMEFGVVEFVRIPGLAAGMRRIVCTGLRNPAMPLIRYSIGDVVTLKEGQCACGRKAPMVGQIDGRIESYITTPDGRRLGRLDFVFKTSTRISEAQLIQESAGSVLVKVVQASGYGPDDEKQLRHDLRRYLGDTMEIKIEYVLQIPREPNGKFRQIVSRVSPEKCGMRGAEVGLSIDNDGRSRWPGSNL